MLKLAVSVVRTGYGIFSRGHLFITSTSQF